MGWVPQQMNDAPSLGKLTIEPWQRHVFLCLGPDCCDPQQGEAIWALLKKQIASAAKPVLRTKVNCLRICRGGPWLVVYPDGVWFGNVTPERCQRIVAEHIVAGRVIDEWAELKQPLCGGCTTSAN